MIDVALTPDGAVVLMAYGDAEADVRVRVCGDSVEIVGAAGRVLAHRSDLPPRPLARLALVDSVDVLLAGRDGVRGYAAAIEGRA